MNFIDIFIKIALMFLNPKVISKNIRKKFTYWLDRDPEQKQQKVIAVILVVAIVPILSFFFYLVSQEGEGSSESVSGSIKEKEIERIDSLNLTVKQVVQVFIDAKTPRIDEYTNSYPIINKELVCKNHGKYFIIEFIDNRVGRETTIINFNRGKYSFDGTEKRFITRLQNFKKKYWDIISKEPDTKVYVRGNADILPIIYPIQVEGYGINKNDTFKYIPMVKDYTYCGNYSIFEVPSEYDNKKLTFLRGLYVYQILKKEGIEPTILEGKIFNDRGYKYRNSEIIIFIPQKILDISYEK